MEKTFFILPSPVSKAAVPDEAGQHSVFEVCDDSMSDGSRYSYEPGDIVICRLLPRLLWWQSIDAGHYDFILMHRTLGALLKRITRHDHAAVTLTLHSLHPLCADCEIAICDVTDIYTVIKVERTK